MPMRSGNPVTRWSVTGIMGPLSVDQTFAELLSTDLGVTMLLSTNLGVTILPSTNLGVTENFSVLSWA